MYDTDERRDARLGVLDTADGLAAAMAERDAAARHAEGATGGETAEGSDEGDEIYDDFGPGAGEGMHRAPGGAVRRPSDVSAWGIAVWIKGTSTATDYARGSDFTSYEITVDAGTQHIRWATYRRYNQFATLRDQVAGRLPTSAPPFPGKTLARTFDEAFIADRRRGLEAWLQCVVAQPPLLRDAAVQSFLALDVRLTDGRRTDMTWVSRTGAASDMGAGIAGSERGRCTLL